MYCGQTDIILIRYIDMIPTWPGKHKSQYTPHYMQPHLQYMIFVPKKQNTTTTTCPVLNLHGHKHVSIPPKHHLLLFYSQHQRPLKSTVTFKLNYRSICIFLPSLGPFVELYCSSWVLTAAHVSGGVLINSVNEIRWVEFCNYRKWEFAAWKHFFIMLL